jgi:hypothetical protein
VLSCVAAAASAPTFALFIQGGKRKMHAKDEVDLFESISAGTLEMKAEEGKKKPFHGWAHELFGASLINGE